MDKPIIKDATVECVDSPPAADCVPYAESSDTIDDVLEALGSPGRYGIRQCFLIMLNYTSFAFPLLIIVFIGYDTPHMCAKLSNQTEAELLLDWKNYTTATLTYRKCSIDIQTQIDGEAVTVQSTSCLNGHDYGGLKYISFVSEWDLVCDQETPLTAFVHTIMVLGGAIGGAVITSLADRFGRKRLVISSQLLLATAGTAASFASNIYVLVVARFFSGFAQSGLILSGWTLILEGVVPTHRRVLGAAAGCVFNSNVALFALVAWLMADAPWRRLQLVTAAVNISVLLGAWLMAESPRWLLVNKKYAQLLSVLRVAAKMNGKDFECIRKIVMDRVDASDNIQNPTLKTYHLSHSSLNMNHNSQLVLKKNTYSLLDIPRNWVLLRPTLILFVLWITCNLTYYGLFLNSSSLAGDRHLNFFLLGAVDFAGDLCIFLFVERLGRRLLSLSALVVATVSLITSTLLTALGTSSLSQTFTSVFFILGKLGIGLCFSGLFIFTPELFPTNIRSAALGLCSSVANLGGMVAPYTSPLREVVSWGPGAIFSGFCILSGALILLLPETKGRSLPETIEDLVRWRKDKGFRRDHTRYLEGKET